MGVSLRVLGFLCPARGNDRRTGRGATPPTEPDGTTTANALLEVEARTHGRTALVALRGELDLATAPQVAEVLDGRAPDAGGVRHVVLDLRGLTFMDANGLAREAMGRLPALTAVEEILVSVDDPADLAPPLSEPLN